MSSSGGEDVRFLYNYFELDDEYKYDIDLMNKDIEEYGLYSYDDFSDYVSYEIYSLFNGQYLKISCIKNDMTFEDILIALRNYLGGINNA